MSGFHHRRFTFTFGEAFIHVRQSPQCGFCARPCRLLLSVSLQNQISRMTCAMLINAAPQNGRCHSRAVMQAARTHDCHYLQLKRSDVTILSQSLDFAPLSFSHVRNWTKLSLSFLGHASSSLKVKINVKPFRVQWILSFWSSPSMVRLTVSKLSIGEG